MPNIGDVVEGSVTGALSEFWDELYQIILSDLYKTAYEGCQKSFDGLFDSLNTHISEAAVSLNQTPESWNASAYGVVSSLSRTAFLPVAAVFLAVVFAWEMVQIVQNTNQSMQQFKPDNIVFPLIKLAMCLLACSHAFEIIMLFFKAGQMVTHKITGTMVGNFGEGLDFTNIVQPELDHYELGDVMAVVGYSAMLLLAKFATWIIGIFIYIRVIFWFLEIYVMSCAAPVPYAMWTNKEWQQVSVNYTRKMLSTMFQGPLMLMLYAIYGGVLTGLPLGSDFIGSLGMIIGSAFALGTMLFRTSSIADSIFGAH